MLVVAWKLKAENLGFFKYSEWSTGMGSMQYVFCGDLNFKFYFKNLKQTGMSSKLRLLYILE